MSMYNLQNLSCTATDCVILYCIIFVSLIHLLNLSFSLPFSLKNYYIFLPVGERKRSNSIKLSNLKQPDSNQKKSKHVIINTESSDPPPQELRNVSSQTRVRPVSLTLHKGEAKAKFSRNRSKSIDYNAQKKQKSFEKVHKLKEKLLHSSPELSENVSDNESTPLVSEISTPSASDIIKTSSSASSSFPLSPLSQKSLSPDIKPGKDQNMTEMNAFVTLYSVNDDSGGKRTTTSDSVGSYYSISPLSSESSVSWNAMSRSSSHLSRQDALDGDILTDVYCDPELEKKV